MEDLHTFYTTNARQNEALEFALDLAEKVETRITKGLFTIHDRPQIERAMNAILETKVVKGVPCLTPFLERIGSIQE